MIRGARLSVTCVLALLGAMLGQNMAYQPDPGWRVFWLDNFWNPDYT